MRSIRFGILAGLLLSAIAVGSVAAHHSYPSPSPSAPAPSATPCPSSSPTDGPSPTPSATPTPSTTPTPSPSSTPTARPSTTPRTSTPTPPATYAADEVVVPSSANPAELVVLFVGFLLVAVGLAVRGPARRRGQGVAEYALVIAFVAVVAIVLVALLGADVAGILARIGHSI